jgi:biotin carboxylase
MAAFTSRTDLPQAWAMRAERARRIATMLSRKDAEAIEAYARECEVLAVEAVTRAFAAAAGGGFRCVTSQARPRMRRSGRRRRHSYISPTAMRRARFGRASW